MPDVRKLSALPVALLTLLLSFGAATEPASSPQPIKILTIRAGRNSSHTRLYNLFKDNAAFAVTDISEGTLTGDASVYDRPDLLSWDAIFLCDYQQKISESGKKKFLSLFDKGVGLIVFHDGLLSYQDWPDYYRIAGGSYLLDNKTIDGKPFPPSSVGRNIHIDISVADKLHPITAGISDFFIKDEIYRGVPNTDDIHTLLTAENKPLVWTRAEKNSRIATFIIGHGPGTWDNPSFQQLLSNALHWVAKK
jgi:type 1 glutamine amidotransferase